MIDEDFLCILIALAVIVLGFVAIVPKLEQCRAERIELFQKHPECLQACRPYTCIRYKREIERRGL